MAMRYPRYKYNAKHRDSIEFARNRSRVVQRNVQSAFPKRLARNTGLENQRQIARTMTVPIP